MAELRGAIGQQDLEEVQRRLLALDIIDINAVDEIGHTALYYACKSSPVTIVRVLLDAGASVNRTGQGKRTPLQEAVIQQREDIVILLLERGANPDIFDGGLTALTLACLYFPFKDPVISRLLAAGADVNLHGHMTPLHAAARQGNPELVKTLVQAGADMSIGAHALNDSTTFWQQCTYKGDTPLHCAARGLRPNNMVALIELGADVNARNHDNETALHLAAQTTPYAVFFLPLFQAGADVLCKDNHGRTPLDIIFRNRIKNSTVTEDKISHFHHIAALLVAAGDRNWACVPTLCLGLEHALLSVWKDAPEDLAELYKRVTKEVKCLIQQCLRVLHGRLPEELRIKVLAAAVTT